MNQNSWEWLSAGLLLSFLLVFAFEREIMSIRFWVLVALVSFVLTYLSRVWIQNWSRAWQAEQQYVDSLIHSMTYEQARLRASELLATPHYRGTKRTSPLVAEGLPKSVAELFEEYEEIVDADGDILRLGGMSREFVQFGTLHDGGFRIVSRRTDGAIFFLASGETPKEEAPDYPSIQHFLVINAGE
jgi:hypothetical protein